MFKSRNHRKACWAILLAAALSAAVAQQPTLEFSPVPLWPPTGTPPPEIAETQFVYFDIRTGEYVMYYPETFTEEGRPAGERKILRYRPQNQVDPIVDVAIDRTEEGEYRYRYLFVNGPRARQYVRSWSIVAEMNDEGIRLNHQTPERWKFYSETSTRRLPPAATQQQILETPITGRSSTMGKFMSWFTSRDDTFVQPGGAADGFIAISPFRPGFTTAYFIGGVGLSVDVMPPEPVMNQVIPLLSPEENWKTVLVIGPRFSAKDSDAWVADNWAYGILRWAQDGRLSATSPFVEEVSGALRLLASQGAGPRRIRAKPETAAERMVWEGLRLSLSFE